LKPVRQGSFATLTPEQIDTPFLDALHRQQRKRGQRDRQRVHLRPGVNRRVFSDREMGGGQMLTHWTAHGFHLLFYHPSAPFWEFVDVPALVHLPAVAPHSC
jgi:hypothetical protein